MCIAVPPFIVGFAEATGLSTVAWGSDLLSYAFAQDEFLSCLVSSPWRIRELIGLRREISKLYAQCREEMASTLTPLADGADLLITMHNYENVAANVAEYHDIPLATLHLFLLRPNGQFLPFLPAWLGNSALTVYWWLAWRMSKKVDDAQRRQLGLAETTGPWSQRIADRGSLEIQAYDEVLFPGLAAEWAKFDGHRPIVGTLTLGLAGDADEEVASWIAAGTPPIFFGFGSLSVESSAETLATIDAACSQLGERALVCADMNDFCSVPHGEHVKVVGALNHATVFPACRAVVHRGSVGITAAGLRAGASHVDPLDVGPTAGLGSSGEETEGRHRPAPVGHHREIASRRPSHHSRPAIRRPGPRDRHPDDQPRRKRCDRRRSCGKFRRLRRVA